jgi:hypothetical protein
MAEFVAFDPRAESKGSAVLATLEGLGFDLMPTLRKHGLYAVEHDGWYPQQTWLDILADVERELKVNTTLDLVSVGSKIPETADWPPDVTTVEEALASIDVAYHMNHRNGEIGYYRSERLDQNTFRVICKNPFPSDFDYGIIYGTVRKFQPEGSRFYIERADSPCRQNGDDECIYFVIFE